MAMVTLAGWTGNSWQWKEDRESTLNLADVVLDHADDVQERMGMEGTEADADRPKNSNCHEDGTTIAGCSKLWIPRTSPCFTENVGHCGTLESCCQGQFVQKDTFWRGSQLIGCPHVVTSETSMLRRMTKLLCYRWERDFCEVSTIAIYTPSHSKWGFPVMKCVCTELEHLTGSHGAPVMGHSVKGQFRSMLDVNTWIPTSITSSSYHTCSLCGAHSSWASCSLHPSKEIHWGLLGAEEGEGGRQGGSR